MRGWHCSWGSACAGSWATLLLSFLAKAWPDGIYGDLLRTPPALVVVQWTWVIVVTVTWVFFGG